MLFGQGFCGDFEHHLDELWWIPQRVGRLYFQWSLCSGFWTSPGWVNLLEMISTIGWCDWDEGFAKQEVWRLTCVKKDLSMTWMLFFVGVPLGNLHVGVGGQVEVMGDGYCCWMPTQNQWFCLGDFQDFFIRHVWLTESKCYPPTRLCKVP